MKIFYKTFGCRVNQIETESLCEKFASAGAQRQDDLENCDMVFINSCSVTEKADRDVLALVRKAAAAGRKIAVTGCYASIFPAEILKIAPEAVIIPNSQKHLSPQILFRAAAEDDFFRVNGSYNRTRAFVKVQDGCSLKCSYCIVPYGRPVMKSKPYLKAVNEVKELVKKGFKEISLSGTRLGCYKCPETNYGIKDLLKGILELEGNFRIRLSSLEPMEIDEEILKAAKQGREKFCDHFHLPLQHCCDRVLKEMKRPYDFSFVKERISMIRSFFGDAGIFADIISAFPTETEEDFEIMMERLSDLSLSGLHAFSYSSRPFAASSKMNDLPQNIKIKRSARARELDAGLRAFFASSMQGRTLRVLSLKKKGSAVIGLSSNFLNVLLPGNCRKNEFYSARISGFSKTFLSGEI